MNTRVCLRSGGVALVLVSDEGGLPRVLHWGADPGPLTDEDVVGLTVADRWGVAPNGPDTGMVLGIVPEGRFGWSGTPGLVGSRDGADWSPEWTLVGATIDGAPLEERLVDAGAGVVEYRAEAPASGLALAVVVEMLAGGLVRAKAEVTNLGESTYRVDELTVNFPVPSEAREILDFGGRWGNERAVQRGVLNQGSHRRESRLGRTGANSAYVLNLGVAGFGYRGERCGACTPRSPATTSTRPSATTSARTSSAAANSCSPPRATWPAGSPTRRRGRTSTTRTASTSRPPASTTTCVRSPSTPRPRVR